MCRKEYHQHSEPFACFDCRKAFRQTSRWLLPRNIRPAPGQARRVVCPQCSQAMADMGPFFKAPRRSDEKTWARLARLFGTGFNFYECECCGPDLSYEDQERVWAFIEGRLARAEVDELFTDLSRS